MIEIKIMKRRPDGTNAEILLRGDAVNIESEEELIAMLFALETGANESGIIRVHVSGTKPIQLTEEEKESGMSVAELEHCVICKAIFEPESAVVLITSGEFQGARHIDSYVSCMISQGVKKEDTPQLEAFAHVGCLRERISEIEDVRGEPDGQ